MITPVLIGDHVYSRSVAPLVGDRVQWRLFWNEPFARFWAGLRPDWSLTAALRPAAAETVTRLGATPEDNTLEQPAIASSGGLHVQYNALIPVPATLTMSGALRVTEGLAPRPGVPKSNPLSRPGETSVTEGIVKRLQVVSIQLDYCPTELWPAWHSLEPIAGKEKFHDLTRPPDQLHSYRPRESDEGESRVEVLLADIWTV